MFDFIEDANEFVYEHDIRKLIFGTFKNGDLNN